jgi:hypothetical protein
MSRFFLAQTFHDISPPVDYSLVPTWLVFVMRAMQYETERLTPYEFSIRVSEILRRYVTDEYELPLTRQTSVEFLESLANTPRFSEDEKSLLGDFLNRCDLIKFARYEASQAESELLLEEATRFVKGARLEPA